MYAHMGQCHWCLGYSLVIYVQILISSKEDLGDFSVLTSAEWLRADENSTTLGITKH